MWRVPVLLVLVAIAVASYCAAHIARREDEWRETIYKRGVISHGNEARLWQVLVRNRLQYPLRVVAIGGSITAGVGPHDVRKGWFPAVHKWLALTGETRATNAGICATGSGLGAERFGKDVLSHQPDLIIIEFAVNDIGLPAAEARRNMEKMVRAGLSQPNKPAVVLLFTMDKDGSSAQSVHAEVGRYYHLPMISCRNALWPEIQAGRIRWEDIAADDVHPNAWGHQWIADIITNYFWQVRHIPRAPRDEPLPPPMKN